MEGVGLWVGVWKHWPKCRLYYRVCFYAIAQTNRIQWYIHTHTYSGTHTYIQWYTHTYIHTVVHTHTHTYIQWYTHTYIQWYTHTYIQWYTHTHTHTHTYVLCSGTDGSSSSSKACPTTPLLDQAAAALHW